MSSWRWSATSSATLGLMNGLGRLIFWDFKRGSWQYDVVVAVILAFIFLTPVAIFEDRPKAASIVMLPANQGFLLEPGLLDKIPSEQRPAEATSLVQKRLDRKSTRLNSSH